jgi:hypothetical protein
MDGLTSMLFFFARPVLGRIVRSGRTFLALEGDFRRLAPFE